MIEQHEHTSTGPETTLALLAQRVGPDVMAIQKSLAAIGTTALSELPSTAEIKKLAHRMNVTLRRAQRDVGHHLNETWTGPGAALLNTLRELNVWTDTLQQQGRVGRTAARELGQGSRQLRSFLERTGLARRVPEGPLGGREGHHHA